MKKRANQELALYAGILEKRRQTCHFLSTGVAGRGGAWRGGALHDVGAVGRGDEDVEVEDDVHVAAEVRSSTRRLQVSVQKQVSAEAPPTTGHAHNNTDQRQPHRLPRSLSAISEKMRRLNMKRRKT